MTRKLCRMVECNVCVMMVFRCPVRSIVDTGARWDATAMDIHSRFG